MHCVLLWKYIDADCTSFSPCDKMCGEKKKSIELQMVFQLSRESDTQSPIGVSLHRNSSAIAVNDLAPIIVRLGNCSKSTRCHCLFGDHAITYCWPTRLHDCDEWNMRLIELTRCRSDFYEIQVLAGFSMAARLMSMHHASSLRLKWSIGESEICACDTCLIKFRLSFSMNVMSSWIFRSKYTSGNVRSHPLPAAILNLCGETATEERTASRAQKNGKCSRKTGFTRQWFMRPFITYKSFVRNF